MAWNANMWIVIASFVFLGLCSGSNVSPVEVSALYDFYQSLNGDDWFWLNVSTSGAIWDFDDPEPNPCDPIWQGIGCSCDEISCTVSELVLQDYNLRGTIPNTISNLTNLVFLGLAINVIHGSIPASITTMKHLMYLDLSDNFNINGPLPDTIDALSNLEFLYVSYNSISGTIPASLFEIPSLRFVEFSDNSFVGSLPDNIGNLENCLVFDISFNNVTGQLPASIGNMSSVSALLLNDNYLVGTIPSEICKLDTLVSLYAIYNYLTGTMPDCIGDLSSLVLLSFNINSLNGTIPPSIVRLNGTLEELTLSYNSFTGIVPQDLFNASHSVLDTVYFSHNSLTGPLPEIRLSSLINLDVSYNYISSTISDSILNSTDLIYLDISYNMMTGTIPSEMNMNNFLFQLVVGHNQFTGTLPDSFEGHQHMAQYMMDYNFFSGTIPFSLCYNDPGYIDLESNLLYGTIPDCAGASGYTGGHLVYFSMSDNYLSGTIPSYVSNEWNVITLSINNNAITGTLPYLNSSIVLEYLYVQDNKLSGPIQLSPSYEQLGFVDISNNHFTGFLPKDFFNDRMNIKSFAATSNCITGTIPEELCQLTNLTFVDLDGLSTAKECRSPIFPGIPSLTSFVLPNHIQGGIPECLFGMQKLQTLHVSGNSIDWSFPTSGLVLGEALSELSLSHNKLTGTIPDVIQNWQWSTLDLSFNKLGGTLNFVEQTVANASLVLQVNRLSGVVPSSLLNLRDINILTGNLFSCDFQRNGLPVHDQAHDTYQCGSNSFNQASIGWAIFAGLSGLFFLTAVLYRCLAWKWIQEYCNSIWTTVGVYLSQLSAEEGEVMRLRTSLLYLRNAMLITTAGVCMVFLPTYAVLTYYYKTTQYQYAWTISAAFLAGVPPAVVLLVFFTILIALLFFLWFNHIRHKTKREKREAAFAAGDEQKVESPFAHRIILLSVVLVNCVVMVSVNAGYVIAVLNDSSQFIFFAQVGVALFKLIWNDFCVRGMVYALKQLYDKLVRGSSLSSGEHSHLKVDMPYLTFIVMFNSIIAPCLATAAVDSNCFYNIIVAPTAVSLQFPYFNVIGTCNFFVAEYTGQTVCGSLTEETFVEVTYDPPFIYSYQCTSSILTNYAAVYVFMFIFVAFFKPVALFLIHRIYTSIPVGSCLHLCIDATIYELLKPADLKDVEEIHNKGKSSSNRKVLFFKDRFVLRMVGKIAVFVTFGVVFPPLAVIVCAAFISEIYVTFMIIGRFLAEIQDEHTRSLFRKLLNKDCEECMKLLLNPLVTLVVPFATLFFGFFVFDIYGDKAGFANAIWAPIFLAMVPAVLWIGYILYKRIRDRKAERNDSLEFFKSSEMSVISVLQINEKNTLPNVV